MSPRTTVPARASSGGVRRRGVLAVGAVGALVVVPGAAAVADDGEVTPELPEATQPDSPEIVLPSPAPEDQVVPAEGAGAEDPSGVAPAPPGGEPQPDVVAMAPYAGIGKVAACVQADGTPEPDLTGARFTVTGDDAGLGSPWTEVVDVESDGCIPEFIVQDPDEELTVTLSAPPPGFLIVDPAPVTVPPCVVEAEAPPTPPFASCWPETMFQVVPTYRTVELRAVDAAGAPVPGVTFELHSPLQAVGAAGVGGGAATAAVPGRQLLASGVTSAAGAADLTVPPGTGYLVVPTAVPDGFMLPPAVSLDLADVTTVAEADSPAVMTFTLVPALAATGTSSSWPLAAVAACLVLTGAGLGASRRRLVPASR